MFNYHELMVGQRRGTSQQRKQYLAICVFGFGIFGYSAINAGVFQPVAVVEGSFPGGEYVYQYRVRDYSASPGVIRRLGEDLQLPDSAWEDLLYTTYVDKEGSIPKAGKTRYFGGALLNNPQVDVTKSEQLKSTLLGHNDKLGDGEKDNRAGDGVDRDREPYKVGNLPKAKAGLAQFPFTNGFLSCLIHQYKVLPAMLKYAQKNGVRPEDTVVLSTCSVSQQMCTFFVPLENGSGFLMDHPSTDLYAAGLSEKRKTDDSISAKNVLEGLKKLSPL